tara:strand:+ start:299 stop:649 length:351 start_codon:yes stop_codon:yes gene_type:complete
MGLISIEDASVYLKQDHYFNKLKEQLSKDFGAEDFDMAMDNLNIEDAIKLNSIIAQYLTYLETQNTETFFQILYRIDIPEADFKSQILTNGLDILALSELVIKRELIKILLREQYS